MLDKLESLIMTNHNCISCGREISDDISICLCENCQTGLIKIDGKICKKCGDISKINNENHCELCFDRNYAFNSSRSLYYYDSVASKIIKNLKYDGKKYLASTIAKIMARESEIFDGAHVITYVPMTKEKFKLRGFNQSEEIARELANLTGKKLVDVLLNVSDGKVSQASLSKEERLKNLKDAFDVKSDMKSEIAGKCVLLIDDVFTTGSTLHECSRALKKAKAKCVKCYTFAKTDFNSIK